MLSTTVQPLLAGKHWRTFCLVASLLIFVADPFTPTGYAHGTLYLLLLMMAAATRDNHFIGLMTGLSLLLTLTGSMLGFDSKMLPVLIANRSTSVVEQVLFSALCMMVNRQTDTIHRTTRDLGASRALIESQRTQLNNALLQDERSQALLSGSRHTFQQFANCVPHLLWTAEADGELDFVNRAMVDYTGLRPEQLYPGNRWMNCVLADDLPHCEESRLRALREGSKWLMQFRLRRHDGCYRWHRAEALPMTDEQGRIYKWCGSAMDVHDLLQP